MTTEEKAKAYDTIIQRVTELYETETSLTMEQMEHLFSELRESEDERIIEEIKFAVMQMPTERQDTKNRCLAWLEKQKELDLTEEVKKWKKDFDRLRKEHYGQKSSVWESPIMTNEMIMDEQKEQKHEKWSEKDKVMFDTISNLLWYGYQESTNENIPTWSEIRTWFLSFYLQHYWKPSEEQMKALQNAVALTACDKELARLYNQLKKL